MNILECIKRGKGYGYREAKREAHRGSKGDGWIDIKFFFEHASYSYTNIITPFGFSSARLTWEDLIAEDWVPKPKTAKELLQDIVNHPAASCEFISTALLAEAREWLKNNK